MGIMELPENGLLHIYPYNKTNKQTKRQTDRQTDRQKRENTNPNIISVVQTEKRAEQRANRENAYSCAPQTDTFCPRVLHKNRVNMTAKQQEQ